MDLPHHALHCLLAPIFVTLLISVLTSCPLFFAFMGDMLGGGFILALGGFFAALAAVDTANPYGTMGASRTRMVGRSVLPGRGLVVLHHGSEKTR